MLFRFSFNCGAGALNLLGLFKVLLSHWGENVFNVVWSRLVLLGFVTWATREPVSWNLKQRETWSAGVRCWFSEYSQFYSRLSFGDWKGQTLRVPLFCLSNPSVIPWSPSGDICPHFLHSEYHFSACYCHWSISLGARLCWWIRSCPLTLSRERWWAKSAAPSVCLDQTLMSYCFLGMCIFGLCINIFTHTYMYDVAGWYHMPFRRVKTSTANVRL